MRFITNEAIYEEVILNAISKARRYVWIGTADIKDMYVHQGKTMVPFLKQLAELIEKGVEVRLIHAKEPGERFRTDFDKYPALITGLERLLCPRVHFKTVVVDGTFAYTGSANLTGAGMGAKSSNRRNFESGVIGEEPAFVQAVMEQFDGVWMGSFCKACGRKEFCGEYSQMK